MDAKWCKRFARRALALVLVVMFLLGAVGQASAAGIVRYAKPGGLTTGTCSTWATACSLSRAITVAVSGDSIWVAKGTHKPTVPTVPGSPRTKSFTLKDGVAIYGGFIGTETLRGQRRPALNVTTLSGEIGAAGDADNVYHVVRAISLTSSAILDGFTITGGNADGSYPDNGGGGMYNNAGSPTLASLAFTGNTAEEAGGGLYSLVGNPIVTHVTFTGNEATDGGGMYSAAGGPTLTDVTFTGNTAAASGGGLFDTGGSPALTHVTFTDNLGMDGGGGIFSTGGTPTLTDVTFTSNRSNWGGGMLNIGSSSVLTNVTFSDNSAGTDGGGIANQASSPTLTNVTFSSNTASNTGGGMDNDSSNPTLTNVTFSSNSATNEGGGMYNNAGIPTLTNVTFTGNTTDGYGGGMLNAGSSPTLTGVTFSSNSAKEGGGGMFNNGSAPTLTDVTFTGNSGYWAGGMWNYAASHPILTNVTFSSNTVTGEGGGMYNNGGSSPTLSNVTFSGNTAAQNGGGMFSYASTPSLTNVTFSGNTALYGGGMYNDSSGATALLHVTFSGNTATQNGGAIYNYNSSPVIRNSIAWGDAGAGEIVTALAVPTITDSIVAGGCPAGATCTHVINADPLLGPLQDNGGFTQTMALLLGSAALDAGGANSSCAPADQRGITRPQGPACDIGAYEHAYAPVVYAQPGGLTSGWCDSWAGACELRYALPLAVNGQQVWVKAGTHRPASGLDRAASFRLKDGVAVYGGFAGSETLLTQRDPAANVTVLSGDLGVPGDTADNSYHVVRAASVTSSAALDGFTITGGNANGAGEDASGGGMLNSSSSPTLANLTFSDNAATDYGGGMSINGGSPVLTDVTFSGNDAGMGAGMHTNGSPQMTNVTFTGNTANDGGGMLNYGSPQLTNVTFSGNLAGQGGGMLNAAGSSPALTNVTFSGNSAEIGGGMFNAAGSRPTLTNATFSGNVGTSGTAGMRNEGSAGADVYNSIFWGNTGSAEIQTDIPDLRIVDSIVAGGCPVGAVCDHVLDADPKLGPLQDNGGFTQTMALGGGSAAVEAGGANWPCASTDQRGTGRPQGPACDMGAYEHVYASVVYASPGGLTSGWCDSWAEACELRYVLPLTVSGQQLWVKAGAYTPGADRAASFLLKNGVAVYGGFAGSETLLTQRNPLLNVTTLSGEIGVAGNADNSYHVVKADSVTSSAILDGFTISGGNANGATGEDITGGGMRNSNGSPTLTNLNFSGNTATGYGGGMHNFAGSPALTNVAFSGNSAGSDGGGIHNYGNPTLRNVTFSGNSADNDGGGMLNSASSRPTLTNGTFSGNTAGKYGGGIANTEMAGPTLNNATFSGNSATFGAAIANHSDLPLQVNVSNSILWGGTGAPEIYKGPTTVNIVDSIVAGGCPMATTCTNVFDADPKLGPLQYNGGFTPTRALLTGSAAIDAGGFNAACAPTDQRGVPRPQGAACDIGAYEAAPTVKAISAPLLDGWVLESGETSGTGGSLDSAATTFNIGDDAARRQYRAVLSFPTGALLPDNAVILSARLTLTRQSVVPAGTDPFSLLNGLQIDVRRGYFGASSALETADFKAAATRSAGPFNPAPTGARYTFLLPATAHPAINRLSTGSGLTQLRLRFVLDDNNNAIANYISFYSGDAATVANRPALTIEYYVP